MIVTQIAAKSKVSEGENHATREGIAGLPVRITESVQDLYSELSAKNGTRMKGISILIARDRSFRGGIFLTSAVNRSTASSMVGLFVGLNRAMSFVSGLKNLRPRIPQRDLKFEESPYFQRPVVQAFHQLDLLDSRQ